MCNCGNNNRKVAPPQSQVPSVVQQTNQILVQPVQDTSAVQQNIQKQMIARRKYNLPAR